MKGKWITIKQHYAQIVYIFMFIYAILNFITNFNIYFNLSDTMLMGSMPFNGKTEEDLFKKIWTGQYRNPPGISFDWKRLLSQILNMDPMKRPSAIELFYDPWNSDYFQGIKNTKRKNSNHSSMKLAKDFERIQNKNNWFATTQKKTLHKRARN